MGTPAERLMNLFRGHGGAYGTHGEPTQQPDSLKWEIKSTARTLRGPTTLAMWEDHLGGRRPLGVIPIREDNMCLWGSIDDDRYDVTPAEVVRQIQAKKLPLVACRSKSGGLHLWLFLREPVPATALQAVLRGMAARLGLAEAEIFPKQTATLAERGDVGNWIIMPYYGDTFGGKMRPQVGITPTGMDMSLEDFLDRAEQQSLTPEAFEEWTRRRAQRPSSPTEPLPPFGDGPPCLQHLAQSGVEGGRNNALFQMGVYHKLTGGRWAEGVERSNEQFMRPPLERDEVTGIIRSLSKKDYEYTCNVEPMCSFCDKSLCRTRRYGIGSRDEYPVISGMTMLEADPPVFFMEVGGKRVEMRSEELGNYRRAHRVLIEQTRMVYLLMKDADWVAMVNEAMKSVVPIEVPPDAALGGKFHEVLEDFLVNKWRGDRREDLLRSKPWEDEEAQRHYFRLRDLERELHKQSLKWDRGRIIDRIRQYGGGSSVLVVSKKPVNVWWVPSTVVNPDPELPVPPVPGDKI